MKVTLSFALRAILDNLHIFTKVFAADPFCKFISPVETCFAVDFRCPVGTAVLAVGNGEVISVSTDKRVSGICAKNLFEWNSIMLKIEVTPDMLRNGQGAGEGVDFVFVEYVHIREDSARVAVGDRVVTGQIICDSGIFLLPCSDLSDFQVISDSVLNRICTSKRIDLQRLNPPQSTSAC